MTDRTSKQSPDITSREDAVEPLARQFGEEILLDYVTGTLDDATRLMVAAQMALRPEISETLAIAGDRKEYYRKQLEKFSNSPGKGEKGPESVL